MRTLKQWAVGTLVMLPLLGWFGGAGLALATDGNIVRCWLVASVAMGWMIRDEMGL